MQAIQKQSQTLLAAIIPHSISEFQTTFKPCTYCPPMPLERDIKMLVKEEQLNFEPIGPIHSSYDQVMVHSFSL